MGMFDSAGSSPMFGGGPSGMMSPGAGMSPQQLMMLMAMQRSVGPQLPAPPTPGNNAAPGGPIPAVQGPQVQNPMDALKQAGQNINPQNLMAFLKMLGIGQPGVMSGQTAPGATQYMGNNTWGGGPY